MTKPKPDLAGERFCRWCCRFKPIDGTEWRLKVTANGIVVWQCGAHRALPPKKVEKE